MEKAASARSVKTTCLTSPRGWGRYLSLLMLLQADTLDRAREALPEPGLRHKRSGVEWLAPLSQARRRSCLGANYPKEHPLRRQATAPEHRFIVLNPPKSLVTHPSMLDAPTASEHFDYEGELADFFGRGTACMPERRRWRTSPGTAA